MRELTARERQQVKALSERAIDFALLEPTRTGLAKSILDATGPVRTFLSTQKLHSYDDQLQGPENKRLLNAKLVSDTGVIQSVASLYRPVTKNGDPRIWFTGLGAFADANDIVAVLSLGGELNLLNISRSDVSGGAAAAIGPIGELISALQYQSNAVAQELLGRLRALASAGPLVSVMEEYADTAIGRTIEHALGISMNSRSEPDFKGIELKSSRIRPSGNKHTLFAKVPDWDISNLKSSGEIVERFGYSTDRDFRLYCTVSSRGANPQSLYLSLNRRDSVLDENSTRPGQRNVAAWRLKSLQKALCEKHAETFWISAISDRSGRRETFQIRTVEHTRSPIMAQFELLLEQGHITVDHLIKRRANGKVSEGGPLFKVSRRAFPLLFPPSQRYELS